MAINTNESILSDLAVDIKEVDVLTYHIVLEDQPEPLATIHLDTRSSPIQHSFLVKSIDVIQRPDLTDRSVLHDFLEAMELISELKGGAIPVLIMPFEFFTKRDEHPCLMTEIGFHYVKDAITEDDMILIPLHRHVSRLTSNQYADTIPPRIDQPVLKYKSTINELLGELRNMGFYLESINAGNRYVFRAFTATAAGYVPCTVIEFEQMPEHPMLRQAYNQPPMPVWSGITTRYQ